MTKRQRDQMHTGIQRAALRVWSEIGGEYITMCRRERVHDTVPRREVLEVVLDADRLGQMLEQRGHSDTARAVRELSTTQLTDIIARVFTCDFYSH